MRRMYYLFCTALIAVGCSFAAEEYPLNRIPCWNPFRKLLQPNPETIRLTGRQVIESKETFPFDPKKRYRLVGEFKAAKNSPDNLFRVGIRPLDENKKQLFYHFTRVLIKTDTVLTADVSPSDRQIRIADGSHWRVKCHDVMAWNTRPDLSDLPNRNIVKSTPQKVTREGNGWLVEFDRPMGVSLKKGTNVRLHPVGGDCRYVAVGSTLKGAKNPECNYMMKDPGIRFFRVVIQANMNPFKIEDGIPVLDVSGLKLVVSEEK